MTHSTAMARRLELRSLRFGVWANAVMTLAGLSAHVLTGSSALLLDGLYSAVLVGSSLIASRICRNVVRPPDRGWPYGYEGQEALYVLFRSLVLLGVIGFGFSSAFATSITDALLVLLVSLVLLREPWMALRQAMAQAAGCSADQDVLERTRAVLMQQLVGLQLQMMDFTVQQLGRTAFVVVYINPVEPQDGFVIDGLRHQIDQRCSSALGRPVRSEVILTVNPPIHHLDPTPQAAP